MTKTKKSNKKKLGVLAILLAIITLAAGTFAWIQSQDNVLNEMSTRQYTDNDVVIHEIFTPPPSWDPGATVDKQVSIVNTGSAKALARVSFEEILYLLDNGGVVTKTDTYNDSSVLTDWIPVQVDISNFVDDSETPPEGINGWTILTSSQIDVSKLTDNPLTGANVTILMKESDGGSYGYFAYRTVSEGVYQKIDLGKNRVNTVLDSSGDFEKVQLLGISDSDENIKFCWYEGRNLTSDTWAGTDKYVSDPTLAGTPPPALRPSLSGTPLTSVDSPLDAMIKINFAAGNVTTNLTTAVTNKIWYYNADDGYFYYMKAVEGGESSEMLIASLKLDEAAGIEHSLMNYKLGIVSDAIQNTKAALSSSSGWSLSSGSLLTELEKLCDN